MILRMCKHVASGLVAVSVLETGTYQAPAEPHTLPEAVRVVDERTAALMESIAQMAHRNAERHGHPAHVELDALVAAAERLAQDIAAGT